MNRVTEIVGPFKMIHVRDTIDGVYHRFVVGPLDTTEDADLNALKTLHHTQEVINAFNAHRAGA